MDKASLTGSAALATSVSGVCSSSRRNFIPGASAKNTVVRKSKNYYGATVPVKFLKSSGLRQEDTSPLFP